MHSSNPHQAHAVIGEALFKVTRRDAAGRMYAPDAHDIVSALNFAIVDNLGLDSDFDKDVCQQDCNTVYEPTAHYIWLPTYCHQCTK